MVQLPMVAHMPSYGTEDLLLPRSLGIRTKQIANGHLKTAGVKSKRLLTVSRMTLSNTCSATTLEPSALGAVGPVHLEDERSWVPNEAKQTLTTTGPRIS